jgi:hypothetical protein
MERAALRGICEVIALKLLLYGMAIHNGSTSGTCVMGQR